VTDANSQAKFLNCSPIELSVSNMSGGQGPAPARGKDTKTLKYVARQAILDREEQVFGYELIALDD